MRQSQPAIVEIASVDKAVLAAFHLKYLPTIFCGAAGLKLLTCYYEALSQVDDAFGWAAVVDGDIAGFACAVGDKRSIRHRLLTRSPVRLLKGSFIQVLHRPRALLNLVKRLRPARTAGDQWHRPAEWRAWYTYRPLVVDEAFRRYRLADMLTEHVIAEAQRRCVPGLISFVERSNSSSRVTHVRHGFREVWRGKDRVVFARELCAADAREKSPKQLRTVRCA